MPRIEPGTIGDRCQMIRLQPANLARRAGCHQLTICRIMRGATIDPRYSTLTEIERAIVAEELRLRDYLVGLHPLVEGAS